MPRRVSVHQAELLAHRQQDLHCTEVGRRDSDEQKLIQVPIFTLNSVR